MLNNPNINQLHTQERRSGLLQGCTMLRVERGTSGAEAWDTKLTGAFEELAGHDDPWTSPTLSSHARSSIVFVILSVQLLS